MPTDSFNRPIKVKLTVLTGVVGICLTGVSLLVRHKPTYLVAQVISIFSGFLYMLLMNRRFTWDAVLSLLFSVAAAIVKDEWLLYLSSLIRSISYQLILIRQLKRGDFDG